MKQLFMNIPTTKILQRVGLRSWLLCMVLLLCAGVTSLKAQQQVTVNLAPIDGVELTPDNIFGYQIQSGLASTVNATIKGKVVYRANGLSFSYSFPYTIRPGLNLIDANAVHAQWTFSSTALKELFMDYKKLPTGTYEYCVEVSLNGPGGETVTGGANRECLYQKSNDIFLINLIDPDNNAKLHEYFPVLSWMVNYPFASALTYKIRVAEVKDGQNNTAAVNRNNPVYQESNIPQTSIGYPVYAKPLERFQPYAWTVDAYYKGILLGGAEPWRFTIIEDSELNGLPKDMSHIDIRREQGINIMYAVGKIKLKYVLSDVTSDVLLLDLTDADGKSIKLKKKELKAGYGDNRYELPFANVLSLKHKATYYLKISNQAGEHFTVQFKYVNPDFL